MAEAVGRLPDGSDLKFGTSGGRGGAPVEMLADQDLSCDPTTQALAGEHFISAATVCPELGQFLRRLLISGNADQCWDDDDQVWMISSNLLGGVDQVCGRFRPISSDDGSIDFGRNRPFQARVQPISTISHQTCLDLALGYMSD